MDKKDKKREKPQCYTPNNDVYPLCTGKGDNPVMNCEECNLYQDMIENY